jgi:hypothetical protein
VKKKQAWNYGSLSTSKRLQHTLRVWIEYTRLGWSKDGWVSGRDIAATTHTLALHSDICALGFNGVKYAHKFGKMLGGCEYKPTYYRLNDIKAAERMLRKAEGQK